MQLKFSMDGGEIHVTYTWANVDTDSGLLPLSEAGVTVEAWGGIVAHPADSKILK
jgi:hypothetical protein